MRLRPHELQRHLQQQGIAPIYILSGDEPLQMNEAADAIRSAARQAGYSGRDVLEAGSRFDWNELAAEANTLSLFAEQRIIDLRIPGGKPGRDGGKALTEYASRPPEDTLLLITLPKLDRQQLNSKWLKALESTGVLIQIWPVDAPRLGPWIEQRMRQQGLTPEQGVVTMLAERIEGNLLAAAQEIDKLKLLQGPGVVTQAGLQEAVADSARYDVFGLVDSALSGQVARSVRMLNGLRAEGTAPAVILWALAREIRLLCGLALQVDQGRPVPQVVSASREVWDKRKPLVSQGLQRLSLRAWRRLLGRCGDADRTIKGQSRQDPWLLLEQICIRMAGAPIGR